MPDKVNLLLWLFLIVTRLRDRLRCPKCKAVGTYKLHAPTPRWRWLCKWCGYYRDKDGERRCRPSPTYRCWIFEDQADGYKGRTPAAAVAIINDLDESDAGAKGMLGEFSYPRESSIKTYQVWPWRG